jgi:DNA-binding transcriptional ArsR family regulator
MTFSTASQTSLSFDLAEPAFGLMMAIAHPLRLSMLNVIDSHKSITVMNLSNELGIEQSVTSQHLRILRENNLVLCNKESRFVNYVCNYDLINNLASQSRSV